MAAKPGDTVAKQRHLKFEPDRGSFELTRESLMKEDRP